MILYGPKYSPFVARAALAARFKGLRYTLTAAPDDQHGRAYRRLHPFGKVPVLRDGSTIVYESSVIVEYLEAKGTARRLVPASAKAAAAARQIGAIASEYVHGAIGNFFGFLRDIPRNSAELAAPAKQLGLALDILEDSMSVRRYASGHHFSIADVYVIPCLWFATTIAGRCGLTNPIDARSKLAQYFTHMHSDTTAGEVIRDMDAEAMWKRFEEKFPSRSASRKPSIRTKRR
jgi:glutathione S-transferase